MKIKLLLLGAIITLGLDTHAQEIAPIAPQPAYIPKGFIETKDEVFFEIDKQGSVGSVEKVIADYNQYIVGTIQGFDKKAQAKADLLDKQGQSFDWKLRMDIIHPEKPSAPRPVFFIIATATTRNLSRFTPYQQIFAKRGYVTVIIDHAYSPLARVFGHKDSYYSLDDVTGVKAYTAAIRYLRANAKRFSIDPDRIGGLGHSKGSYAVARLADPDINAESDEWKGKLAAYGPQPNPGYASNIQVGYQSMGNGTRKSQALVKNNYAPMITAVGKLDPAKHWDVWPNVVKAYSIDHDANWLGIPMLNLGHDMAVGLQPDLGYTRELVVERFFAAYLEPNLPPVVLYAAPFNGNDNKVTDTSVVALHFAPKMDAESVIKASKVIDLKTKKQLKGEWKVSREHTYFQFVPDKPFTRGDSYQIEVSVKAKSMKLVPLSQPYLHSFTISKTE